MARPSLSLRRVPTMLVPPAAFESGDSFADRSSQGMPYSHFAGPTGKPPGAQEKRGGGRWGRGGEE
eukprot:4590346-Pyramimonas_sp.AAC.1